MALQNKVASDALKKAAELCDVALQSIMELKWSHSRETMLMIRAQADAIESKVQAIAQVTRDILQPEECAAVIVAPAAMVEEDSSSESSSDTSSSDSEDGTMERIVVDGQIYLVSTR